MLRSGEDLEEVRQISTQEIKRIPKLSKVVPINSSEAAPKEAESQPRIEDSEEKLCRICMEPGRGNRNLISPCRCAGSVKYIHEICLKTWLVSQTEDIAEAKCELCKEKFDMEFKIEKVCVPTEYCRQGAIQCLFVPLLLIVMGMLFIVAYLLSDKYLSNADTQEKGYIIALIVTCGISGFVILVLILNSLRETCTTSKLTEWVILSKNYENEAAQASEKDEKSRDETLLDRTVQIQVAGLGDSNEKDEDDLLERSIQARPIIMVVPKNLKIGNKKVKTPILDPPMVPVFKYGKLKGFTPKFMTPTGTISPMMSLNLNGASQTDPFHFKEPGSPQYHMISSKAPFLNSIEISL